MECFKESMDSSDTAAAIIVTPRTHTRKPAGAGWGGFRGEEWG